MQKFFKKFAPHWGIYFLLVIIITGGLWFLNIEYGVFRAFLVSPSGVTCKCSTQIGCENDLNNDSCEIVELGNNITGGILFKSFENKTLDCQGKTISGGGGYGIYLNGKSGNIIKNCIITGFTKGIFLENNSNNNVLENNTISGSNESGIRLSNSSQNILEGNASSFNGGDGIIITGSSNNTLIDNITDSNGGEGIELSGKQNTLTGNIAEGNKRSGLLFGSASPENTVDGNRFCFNNTDNGNYQDIRDLNTATTLNSGDDNICDTFYRWSDNGATGCTISCKCVDNDNDGYYGYNDPDCTMGDDCNDGDDTINPAVIEVCDGIDNNCDGSIDEDEGDCVGSTPFCVGGECKEAPEEIFSGMNRIAAIVHRIDGKDNEYKIWMADPIDASIHHSYYLLLRTKGDTTELLCLDGDGEQTIASYNSSLLSPLDPCTNGTCDSPALGDCNGAEMVIYYLTDGKIEAMWQELAWLDGDDNEIDQGGAIAILQHATEPIKYANAFVPDGEPDGIEIGDENYEPEHKSAASYFTTAQPQDDNVLAAWNGGKKARVFLDEDTTVCGDSIWEEAKGEECDPGPYADPTGCDSGTICSSSCVCVDAGPACGDGVIGTGEECDDGNTNDGDGCSAVCTLEGGPTCGNGTLDADEECDGGTGCTTTCTCDTDYQSTTPKSVGCELIPALCGNGTLDADEECDDGNTDDGDGCSFDCKLEEDTDVNKIAAVLQTIIGDINTKFDTEARDLTHEETEAFAGDLLDALTEELKASDSKNCAVYLTEKNPAHLTEAVECLSEWFSYLDILTAVLINWK